MKKIKTFIKKELDTIILFLAFVLVFGFFITFAYYFH